MSTLRTILSLFFIFQCCQQNVLCQSDSRLAQIYAALSKEKNLTVRMDELGQKKFVVFYPNGILREDFRMSGILGVDEKAGTIGISFRVPIEQLNLIEETRNLEFVRSHLEPWNIALSPNSIGGDLQLSGDLILNQDIPNAQIIELLSVTLNRLESWLIDIEEPHVDSLRFKSSEPCQSLLTRLGLNAGDLNPLSLERLCYCADWHTDHNLQQGDFWFDCALHAWIIMDELTPQPMVTCRKPECIIPLEKRGDQYFIELEFPSGQSHSLLLFVEDILLMLNNAQFDAITEGEGWLPSNLKRPDYTLPSSANGNGEFNHFGLPTFEIGDVTFSSQSVIVPQTGHYRPYFSAGLLSALGAWEVDYDNLEIRIIPWAFMK